jgi:hypothetical protein
MPIYTPVSKAKHLFTTFVALSLVAVGLAPCAGTATPVEEPVTIRFVFLGDLADSAYYEALAREFGKDHPGVANECRFPDRSIYHLDSPGALRHLDSLLSIAELDAIQFVFGAGNKGFHKWVDVYRRIQATGKGIQVTCAFDELPQVMETLDPRGLYLDVGGAPSHEAVEGALRELEKWSTNQG